MSTIFQHGSSLAGSRHVLRFLYKRSQTSCICYLQRFSLSCLHSSLFNQRPHSCDVALTVEFSMYNVFVPEQKRHKWIAVWWWPMFSCCSHPLTCPTVTRLFCIYNILYTKRSSSAENEIIIVSIFAIVRLAEATCGHTLKIQRFCPSLRWTTITLLHFCSDDAIPRIWERGIGDEGIRMRTV